VTVRRSTVWLAIALAGGCMGEPYRFDVPRAGAGIEIAPYEEYEQCVALDRGWRLDFYFVSVAPVAFNIRYHEANAVIMPIVREHATRESGEFAADHKDVYCVTWEAGVEPSLLEYRLRPLPPR
jgi:hypothetical protein